MSDLHEVASQHVNKGWKIVSISDTTLVLTRKAAMNIIWVIFGILGLLFAVIPGLLAFLIGYISRGDEQLVFSAEEATAWLIKAEATKSLPPTKPELQPLIVIAIILVVLVIIIASCLFF